MGRGFLSDRVASIARVGSRRTVQLASEYLRKAIAVKLERDNHIVADPEMEILVTNGGNHGLCLALTYALNPSDEVIVPSPCYFFDGMIRLMEGAPVYVDMQEEQGFRLDISRVKEKITAKTKVIIVNTPVNPTGYVATMDDLMDIGNLAVEHDLLIIADESYEKMTYDGRRHCSIGSIGELRERTITIHSLIKSYAMPSWRIGYVVAPRGIVDSLLKILEWMVLCCSYVAQKAAAAALSGPSSG